MLLTSAGSSIVIAISIVISGTLQLIGLRLEHGMDLSLAIIESVAVDTAGQLRQVYQETLTL